MTNYQSPACTGPLHFVGASGKLECDYCGAKYDGAQIEALYAEKEAKAVAATEQANAKAEQNRQKIAEMESQGWDTSGLSSDWGAEADGMKAYSCPSCGAELICDASTAATSCPYCGNPTVVPGQFSGALKPDFVIPFKLSKEDAVAALKNHYKGKPLLPKAFTNGNHIEEIKEMCIRDRYFSLCPICKRLVCDRCFLLGEDIDLCTDCAAFLQEHGEPVEGSSAKHG